MKFKISTSNKDDIQSWRNCVTTKAAMTSTRPSYEVWYSTLLWIWTSQYSHGQWLCLIWILSLHQSQVSWEGGGGGAQAILGAAVATEQSRPHKSWSAKVPHLCLFTLALSLKAVFVTLAPAPHTQPQSGHLGKILVDSGTHVEITKYVFKEVLVTTLPAEQTGAWIRLL